MTKTRYFCICCGLEEPRHRYGCATYRKTLDVMFGGDFKKIIDASSRGLLPRPPWKDHDARKTKCLWEARALELRNQGLKWREIADQLNAEGFTSGQGRKLDTHAVQMRIWYSKKKKQK